MNKINQDLAMEHDLKINDLCLLSYLDVVSTQRASAEFSLSYKEIIEDLPIVFNLKTYDANCVKMRRILDKRGMKEFVTRKVIQQGRGKGALVTFKLNKRLIRKLSVKGIVS